MNKFLQKVAKLFLGLSMAAGIGVAVSARKKDASPVHAGTANFKLSSESDVTVDGVTASFAKASGSTAPTWYSAGLRLYASNTVTISSSSSITGVSFNWEKQGNKAFATVTASAGNYTHPSNTGTGTWTGEATSITFTLGGSGQLQLNTFSVTYDDGGGGGGGGGSFEPDHTGTSADPYSVSDALGLTQDYSSTEVASQMSYVKGVVSSLSEDNADDWGKFDISDGTNTIYCSGVKGISTTKGNASYVNVGYEVVIHGYLQKYEGDQMVSWDDDSSGSECYLVSSNKAAISSFTASIVSGTYYANSKLVASNFTTQVSYTNGPQNISVPETDDLEWMVGEEVDGYLQAGSNTVTLFYWTKDVVMSVTGTEIKATDISFDAETYFMGKNSSLTLTPILTPSNTTDVITWTSSNTSAATVDNGVVTSGGSTGKTTITATINGHSASCVVKVRNITTNTDEITLSTTGVSGTSYTAFSNKSASNTGHSDAIYAGKIAGGNSSIQLNTNSDLGFVSTSSGGNLKSITIEWNSSTSSSRSVKIFAKNSAYSSASDLDSSSTRGTQVGSLEYSTTANTYTFADTYTNFGLKANGGALYISKLTVVWESIDETKTISSVEITTPPTKTSYAVGEELDVSGLVLTATYEEEDVDPSPVTYKVYDGSTEITTSAKYAFTDTDYSNGSKSFTIKAIEDETKTATLTISSITPAYPKQINVSTTAKWTDSQTLAQGSGRYTVIFTDTSHNVTNVKIGDSNTSIEYNSTAISGSALAKDYDGKTIVLKYTDPASNVTVSKNIEVSVDAELSVDSFGDVPDYVLVTETSESITANFTSLKGAPDSYNVVSSNDSKLGVNFDSSSVSFNTTTMKGTLAFTVTGGNTQGQYNVTVSITKGQRTESKSISIIVRSETPSVGGTEYKKISTVDAITTGQYVIAAKVGSTYSALSTISTGKISGTAVTVANDTISDTDAGLLSVDITKIDSSHIAISKSDTYLSIKTSGTDFGTSTEQVSLSVALGNVSGRGTFKISNTRALIFNGTQFGNYATSNVTASGSYYYVELFKKVTQDPEVTSFDLVKDWVDGYLYMNSISITDKGNGECKGEEGLYLTAKRAWNTMITSYEGEDNLQTVFHDSFPDAYDRYMAWATACEDTAPFVGTTIVKAPRVTILGEKTNIVAIIVIISMVSVTAIGGYFFLRKRKENI